MSQRVSQPMNSYFCKFHSMYASQGVRRRVRVSSRFFYGQSKWQVNLYCIQAKRLRCQPKPVVKPVPIRGDRFIVILLVFCHNRVEQKHFPLASKARCYLTTWIVVISNSRTNRTNNKKNSFPKAFYHCQSQTQSDQVSFSWLCLLV